MKNSIYRWIVLAVLSLVAAMQSLAAEKPRLLVLTDMGADPDDQQSMVRLMGYANEFDIEGLIATSPGTSGEARERPPKPELIREIVEAYGKVRDNLALHSGGFPRTERLLECIKSGSAVRGTNGFGEGRDTEASRWIISLLDKADPRPVNVAIWGGQTDLAQALWRIRQDRGAIGVKAALAKLRIYDIADQDHIQNWFFENFGDAFYILGNPAPGHDKRDGVFRGMYLGGDESLTSLAWLDTQVRTGHGPLGALYPPKTWTAPNRNGALKEGDTPSWFYFLPNGLGDIEHPDWGCWGGRFQHATRGLWRDAVDTVGAVTDARATVWRWRAAYQNDFAARMDCCVKPFAAANHPPKAVVNGDQSQGCLTIVGKAGDTVSLSAKGSSDPDGNHLRYHWWIYFEVGNGKIAATIAGPNEAETVLTLPADGAAGPVHVILEVTDDGTPALTSYRRVVVDVR